MRTIIVQPGQTLIDIAVREYGDVMGFIELLRDNPEIEQGGVLDAGTELIIDGEIILKDVVAVFDERDIDPATNQTYIAPATTQPYYEVNYIINGYFE